MNFLRLNVTDGRWLDDAGRGVPRERAEALIGPAVFNAIEKHLPDMRASGVDYYDVQVNREGDEPARNGEIITDLQQASLAELMAEIERRTDLFLSYCEFSDEAGERYRYHFKGDPARALGVMVSKVVPNLNKRAAEMGEPFDEDSEDDT